MLLVLELDPNGNLTPQSITKFQSALSQGYLPVAMAATYARLHMWMLVPANAGSQPAITLKLL